MGLAVLMTCEIMGFLGSVALGTWLVAIFFVIFAVHAVSNSR